MSKATVADVEALGLHRATFEKSEAEWPSFVQAVLDSASLEVQHLVGAAFYAAPPDALALSRLIRLEALMVSAELLLRAESYAVRNISGEETSKIADSSRMRQRQRLIAEANGVLASMGLPPMVFGVESGFSAAPQGAVGESSHFAEDQ